MFHPCLCVHTGEKKHRWGEKRVYNCLFAIVFMGTMKQLATNITNVNQWTDMSPMVTNGLTCHQCLPMDWHDFRIGVWNTKAKCWTEEQILNWLLDSWIKASCLMLWVFICTKKIQNGSRNSWVMAFFPWEVPLRTTWDKRKSFLVHLYQKDLKSVRKWLSYCHFLPESLRDSIENHMGPRGILLCSFLPKGSKTSQEIAEIWNFPTERLRDSIENNMGKRGSFGVHLYQKYLNLVKRWLSYGFFLLRGCMIQWELDGTKGDPWVFICTKNI